MKPDVDYSNWSTYTHSPGAVTYYNLTQFLGGLFLQGIIFIDTYIHPAQFQGVIESRCLFSMASAKMKWNSLNKKCSRQ